MTDEPAPRCSNAFKERQHQPLWLNPVVECKIALSEKVVPNDDRST